MTIATFIERSQKDRELWKYTDLEALLKRPNPITAFRRHPVNCEKEDIPFHTRFIFVDGVFNKSMSSEDAYLEGSLESGYVLTVKTSAEYDFIFIDGESSSKEIPLKFTINVSEGGNLSLFEYYHPTNTPITVSSTVTLALNATMERGRIIRESVHLASHEVHLGTSCAFRDFCILNKTPLARNELAVTFEGENAHVTLNGIMLLQNEDHADTTTKILHNAPQCTSRQSYRTVLDNKSHGVFQGQIVVAKGAQKTDGHQLSRALLLSDKAEMNAKPELQIFADDVKCSHGNTIGDLNEDVLFYLRSRGLSERQARTLLIEGFVSEVLDEITVDHWRDTFARVVREGIK